MIKKKRKPIQKAIRPKMTSVKKTPYDSIDILQSGAINLAATWTIWSKMRQEPSSTTLGASSDCDVIVGCFPTRCCANMSEEFWVAPAPPVAPPAAPAAPPRSDPLQSECTYSCDRRPATKSLKPNSSENRIFVNLETEGERVKSGVLSVSWVHSSE